MVTLRAAKRNPSMHFRVESVVKALFHPISSHPDEIPADIIFAKVSGRFPSICHNRSRTEEVRLEK